MLWEQALDILLSGTGMCNASLMKVMHLFCILLKQSIYFLLDKNYCRKMQSVWGWTSARWVNYPWQRNIKKYIVQTFEPCVKQRFAPKLAVCYWLYNVNLIKKSKIVYNLGMKRRTHIKWEGFLNCKDLMKLPFVMSITHGKFISSREKLLWQPFLNWCRLIKSFSLSLSLSLIVKYLILPFCQSILVAWHFQKWVRIYIIYI